MPSPTRAVGIAIVVAAAAGHASPALAGGAVYGGSTSKGAPNVINADKKAKALRSAVVSWSAACDDGRRFPGSVQLKAVVAEPGFTPGFRELATSQNGKGRFKGIELGTYNLGDRSGGLIANLSGKLTPKRASGKLSATIIVLDNATGDTVATCRTGSVSWSATRSPGRVYAGSTAQDHPVVVRLDAKRRTVADLLFGWESGTCRPDDLSISVDERFGGFPLQGGHFGDAFDQQFDPGDGGQGKVSYDITGRVAKTRASGSLHVNVVQTDATGATTAACDSGAVSWSAVTG
jgi:hypothetical protein